MKSVAAFRLALAASSVLIPASLVSADTFILGGNSTLRGVHLFNSATGALIDRNFIVDPRMTIPQEPMRVGNEIWVTDQGASVGAIWRFNQRGLPLGKIDVAATFDTANVRGMAIVPRTTGDEVWLAQASAGGAAPGRFLRYSLAGVPLGTINTVGDNVSPYDILTRANDLLVTDSQSDDIDRYDFNGNHLGKFVDSAGGSLGYPLNFPQQMAQFPNGVIGVISFSLPAEGIRLFDASGAEWNPNLPNDSIYDDSLATGSRGIAPLDGNGFIHSRGDGFYTRPQIGSGIKTATTVLSGPGLQSGRWLNRVTLDVAPLPAAIEWANAAGGNWTTGSNWTNPNFPDAVPESARFGSVIPAARAVTLDSNVSLISVTFDSPNSYLINGSGSIHFGGDAPQAFTVSQGSHVIVVPVTASRPVRMDVANSSKLTLSMNLNTGTGDIVKLGGGDLDLQRIVQGGNLVVSDGKVTLTAPGFPGTASRVTGLWVGSATTPLDIGLNDLIIDGPTPMSLATLRSYCSVGRVYAITPGTAIRPGFARAGSIGVTTWDGQAVSPDAVIVRRTLPGDANLDRTVNFDDLLLLAANYNSTTGFWFQGDFNHRDGVNFDDLLLLAANYNQTLPGGLEGDWALAQSTVPEPTALAAFGAAAAGALHRRRRRR